VRCADGKEAELADETRELPRVPGIVRDDTNAFKDLAWIASLSHKTPRKHWRRADGRRCIAVVWLAAESGGHGPVVHGLRLLDFPLAILNPSMRGQYNRCEDGRIYGIKCLYPLFVATLSVMITLSTFVLLHEGI